MVSKYNYVFLIPSYDRYEKLTNLINQIKNIDNYLVIVLDDGSTDIRYNGLNITYEHIKVIKNEKNNGKDKFNLTIKSLLSEAIINDGDYFVLLADDLILCNNFTKILDNHIQELYVINILSLYPTMWNINGWIDGAFVASKGGIETILNLIPENLKTNEGKSTGVWSTVTKKMANGRYKYTLKNLNYSLVQHNGNDDSKLHPKFRLITPITVENFYDDYIDKEIKIIDAPPINNKKKKFRRHIKW